MNTSEPHRLFTFRPRSFVIACILFLMELIIAVCINDNFIRPFVGDVLVVIFIYYFIKSFLNVPLLQIALFTLLFSFTIEILQYFRLVDLLGLGNYKWARIVIGTSFSWWDLVCYFIGVVLLFIFDTDLRQSLKKLLYNDFSRTNKTRNT